MEGVMEIVPAYNFIKFRNLAAEALRIVCWALACAWIETNLHQLVWQLICLTITFILTNIVQSNMFPTATLHRTSRTPAYSELGV